MTTKKDIDEEIVEDAASGAGRTEQITVEEDEAKPLYGAQRIELSHPIKIGQREVTELHLQELRAKHLRGLPVKSDLMEFGNLLDMAGKCSGEPQKVIDNLSPEDTARVVAVVSGFIVRFQ